MPPRGMPPPPGAPQPQPIRSSELHRLRGLRDSLRATGGDGDGSADPVVLVPLMEAELAATSDAERASTLEDSIADARIAAEFGVRRAQLEFYGALSSADSAAMRSVWSSEPDVRCVHPGMGALEGIDAVMRSWDEIFASQGDLDLEPAGVVIDLCGQTAVVTCTEETSSGGRFEAVSIYRREAGEWYMTLRQSSPIMS